MITSMVKRNPYKPAPALPHTIFLLITAGLIPLWGYLFSADDATWWRFFELLAVSAFWGTALRTLLRLRADEATAFSWRQLFSDALLGLYLAVILGLFYVAGGSIVTGEIEFVKMGDVGDFRRIGITITILGVSSAWLMEQAAEEVKKLAGGCLSSLKAG